MVAEHGSASRNANERNALMPLISLTDSKQESESSRQPRVNQKTTNTITLGPGKKLKSSAYVSSSSSESSSEDLFQMNPKVTSKSSAKPLLREDKIDISSDTSSKSDLDSGSIDATSPVSDLTHESMLQNMSPTQSPPMQMMERPRDYDPCRIPESVFDSKSPMPMEWSVASTESLFSIHIGNNSFSREHVHMMGGDLYKSGELNKSGEANKSPELMRFKPAPPVAVVGKSERKGIDLIRKNGATKVFDENSNYDPSEAADDQSEEKLPHPDVSWDSSNANQRSDRSATTHNRSDESGLSSQSFPFPISQMQKKKKSKKSAWPKCHCSNCSWVFCYCTWPSCYCKWPRCYCSNCSWAFCYFWNCKRQRFCCYSSSDILTDEGTGISAKGNHKQQHSQPKKASKKWYSCFCCFSKCCHSWSCSKCCRSWSCSNWCPWSWSSCCSWLSCSNCCSSWSCSNCCSCSKCSSFWSCSKCFSCLSCSKCFSCLSCSKCSCLSCSKCCSCWSRK